MSHPRDPTIEAQVSAFRAALHAQAAGHRRQLRELAAERLIADLRAITAPRPPRRLTIWRLVTRPLGRLWRRRRAANTTTPTVILDYSPAALGGLFDRLIED